MASWILKQDPAPYEIGEFIVAGILPIVLIVLGTLGNLVSIAVLARKANRQTSTNVYLIFLCIMDTLSLYQWTLNYAVYEFTHGRQQIVTESLFLCKTGLFLSFYTLHTSAMFLTFVELDRACLLRSVWYKRKVAQPRVALAACLLTLVLLFALNGFLFGLGVEFPIYDNGTATGKTFVVCYYSLNAGLIEFFSSQYAWIHVVVVYIVPFSIMSLCTLSTAKKLLVKQTNTNEQLVRSAQRNRRISAMLLLMCLAYFVTTLPNRLCFSVFLDQLIGHDYTDLVLLSTNTLMAVRCAINIVFFYASVSSFRRDIRRVILECRGRITGQVVPVESNVDGPTGLALTAHRTAMASIPVESL